MVATALSRGSYELESRYELFKISFFNRYRWCVVINSIVAFLLAVILIILTVKANDEIQLGYEWWFAVVSIALSYLPAPIMLAVLWLDARREVGTLGSVAASIETRVLQPPNCHC